MLLKKDFHARKITNDDIFEIYALTEEPECERQIKLKCALLKAMFVAEEIGGVFTVQKTDDKFTFLISEHKA